MILITTPENTWKPWKPVIKKKKSANNLLPYSFLIRFAPSTTSTALCNLCSDSALVRIVFCFILFQVGLFFGSAFEAALSS